MYERLVGGIMVSAEILSATLSTNVACRLSGKNTDPGNGLIINPRMSSGPELIFSWSDYGRYIYQTQIRIGYSWILHFLSEHAHGVMI